jgi:hypothetical protein
MKIPLFDSKRDRRVKEKGRREREREIMLLTN